MIRPDEPPLSPEEESDLRVRLAAIGVGWSLSVIGGSVLQAERRATALHRQEALTPEALLEQVEHREAEIRGEIPRGETLYRTERR